MSFVSTPKHLSLVPTAGDLSLGLGQTPLYSARFPVYQVDFTASSGGKLISMTKRRIRWSFGFSNAEALRKGLTGTDCRGEEHNITFIWSVTSGKRLILADGQEVYFSANRPEGKFEFSWTMRGNHIAKIVAHATPSLGLKSDFRQFDLLLDGQSFFEMPKIFELGVTKAGGGGWVESFPIMLQPRPSMRDLLMLTSRKYKASEMISTSNDGSNRALQCYQSDSGGNIYRTDSGEEMSVLTSSSMIGKPYCERSHSASSLYESLLDPIDIFDQEHYRIQ